ncbi:MAG: universal stress protein [Chloroflexota bacterium]|nr:universal stress protein [Chloroflexota bacterium]MDQ5866321.1 universal stress protein [Chloroflexota bacterium]
MARIFSRKEGEVAPENKLKRILVPVKGAEIDEEAMRLAYTYALAKIGKGRSVSVDVVYVVEVPHSLPLNAELSAEIEKGERALDRAEVTAREMGLTVDASILQARSAGAAIVDVARESGAELIVLATSYQKKLGELDLGRTLPYVLKHAPCRVWICRAPMPEEDDRR